MWNNVKTVVFLVLLGAIALGIGAIFGTTWLIVGGVLGVVIAFSSYWWSDKLALQMAGAREVTPDEEPQLHQMVEEVAYQAKLPKPKVYVVHNDAPNAFATGRNPEHAVVAVTTGIRRMLDERELRAVLGHELGHIRNRDMLINAVVAAIAIAIMVVARMLFWASLFGGRSRSGYGGLLSIGAILIGFIVAPLAAAIVRAAISRSRESAADETGAQITGTPLALASALEKMQQAVQARPMEVNPAISHLFIVNPLKGGDFVMGLFRSHPPIPERVERLNEIARKMGSFS
ncbi:MAG: M48 family metalloprotease [Dehalococcoidia bacterium]|nr:M48 family metalloprotease [Dehalococcoidia bacterium]